MFACVSLSDCVPVCELDQERRENHLNKLNSQVAPYSRSSTFCNGSDIERANRKVQKMKIIQLLNLAVLLYWQ